MCAEHCRVVWRAARYCLSSSFGLTRPLRPRFGMSIRRPAFAALLLDLKTATAVLGFLPLAAARPFLARQESLALSVLHCVAALRVIGPIASG